jgi:hypothetical protein
MDHKEFEDRLQRITLFKQKQIRELFLDFIGENQATGLIKSDMERYKEQGKNELKEEQRKIVIGE